jgi:hypothetical protein
MVARKSYRPISAWRSSVTLRELDRLGEGLQVVERDGRQTRDTSLTVPGNGMVVALAIVPAIGEANLNASAAPKTFPTMAEGSYDRRAKSRQLPRPRGQTAAQLVNGIILLIKTARVLSLRNSDLNFMPQ